MLETLARSVFVSFSLFALVGCAAAEDETLPEEEETLDEAAQSLAPPLVDPPRGGNHFCSICFWAPDTQAAYRIMGAGALDQGDGELPVLVLNPAYRDEVIQNAVECGLGADQKVIDPVTHKPYSGHWGLARSWEEAALTPSQRRWVTACMAQRLNAFLQPVEILLEGRHSAIQRHSTYDSLLPWDESTVWGDLFSSVAPLGSMTPPFDLYACSDGDLEVSCVNSGSPTDWLDYRICDSSPACGLQVLGSCSNVCSYGGSGYPLCPVPGGAWAQTVHVQLAEGTCKTPP